MKKKMPFFLAVSKSCYCNIIEPACKASLFTAACRPGQLNQHNAKGPINLIYVSKPPTGKTSNQADGHPFCARATE